MNKNVNKQYANKSGPHRNRPIATLIKWYADKRSGKVCEARREIQRRFDGLDWRHQKQIMSLFLDGCATDKRWAFWQLYTHWDSSFESKIANLWDKVNDFEYLCTVTHCMPMEFVLKHLDRLDFGRNYLYICKRFAGCKGFTVEKDKLEALNYLALIYKTEFKEIDDDEALNILFEITRYCCLCWTKFETTENHDGETFVTPFLFSPIEKAIYYLRNMGRYQAINDYKEWNEQVKTAIAKSDEHEYVKKYIYSVNNLPGYTVHDFHIAFKYAYIQLGEKYKQSYDPSIEDILERIRSSKFHSILSESEPQARLHFTTAFQKSKPVVEIVNNPSDKHLQIQQKMENILKIPMNIVRIP